MGWKPGKLLKKAFKGVRKITKKIGKGIKKLAFKVLGAFNKLGPIGQLALMFIGIPPVIGNFFGAIGSAVGSAVGSFAQSVLPKAFTTAVQGAWGAIKTAGQGAYNTITEAIGNGLDRVTNFAKGKGFTLSGDRTSIFGGVSAKDIKVPDLTSNVKVDASGIPELVDGKLQFTDAPTTLGDRLMATVDPTTVTAGPQTPFTGDIDVLGATVSGNPADLGTAMGTRGADILTKDSTASLLAPADVSDITNATLDFGIPEVTPVDSRTFGQKAKDYFTEGFEGVKESLSDPKELAKETVKGGVIAGGTSRIASAVAGPPPTQRVIHSNIGDFFTATTQQRLLDAATWNGMVGDYQRAGAYGGAMHGDAASPYFAAASGMSLDVYSQLAPRTAPSNATSSTYGTAYYPTISL